MRNKAGRQRAKSAPRRCIFCGEGGGRGNPMSKEHLWPEWMHPLLPTLENPIKQPFYEHTKNGFRHLELGKAQQGHPYTTTFNVVCKRCNETWMSRIEEGAKAFLIPMLQGLPVTLNREAKTQLATWFALKLAVIDQDHPEDGIWSWDTRHSFRSRRNLPQGLRIWVGNHNSENWYTLPSLMKTGGSFGSQPTPNTESNNIEAFALGVGHIFSFSLFSTVPGLSLSIGTTPRLLQLWPLALPNIAWPPAETLSEYEADAIALSLESLVGAQIRNWVPIVNREP